MIFRKAEAKDVPAIVAIIDDGVRSLRDNGVNQWQDGYPNEEVIRADIDKGISYVVEDGGKVVATAAISFEPEPTYAKIDGAWVNDEPYAVVHRSAVSLSSRGKGYGKAIFDGAESLCRQRGVKNIRVDTHRDNMSMQALINSKDFTFCGIIEISSESDKLRNAYQKVL